jgi:hypothetical protein
MANTTQRFVHTKDGEPVEIGSIVVNSRGEQAKLVFASAMTVPGKSGKVVVEYEGQDYRSELYAHIFGLVVTGIMDCGCPVGPDDPGHLDSCTVE